MSAIALCCFYEAYPPASGAASVSYNLAKFWSDESLLIQLGPRDGRLITTDGVRVITIGRASESRLERLIRLPGLIRRITAEIVAAGLSVIVLEGASWALYHRFLLQSLRNAIPHAKIVYHSHNVEYLLRCQRHNNAVAMLTRWAEGQVLKLADLTTAVSQVDQDHFVRLYGMRPVLLPNGVDTARFGGVDSQRIAQLKVDYQLDERTLLFAGLYSYGPNREAIDFLMRSIMPKLRERYASATLAITGGGTPYCEPWLKNVGSIAYCDFAGFVAACGVAVAPIFSGSGTRLKILEAMAAGIPVVATEKAAEGLPLRDGIEVLFASNADEFVRRVGDLFDNPDLALRLREGAATWIAKFSWKAIVSDFERVLGRVMPRVPAERIAGSIGGRH